MKIITQQRLKELFFYDPITGVFERIKKVRGIAYSSPVGSPNQFGHIRMAVDGKRYQAHHLAWLYMYGSMPSGELDHKNGIPNDNSIDNLRDVSHGVNMQNQRHARGKTKSGRLGVVKNGNRWQSRIKVDGVLTILGNFPDQDSAYEEYIKCKRKLHIGCEI